VPFVNRTTWFGNKPIVKNVSDTAVFVAIEAELGAVIVIADDEAIFRVTEKASADELCRCTFGFLRKLWRRVFATR
jgi:hypothetical protein